MVGVGLGGSDGAVAGLGAAVVKSAGTVLEPHEVADIVLDAIRDEQITVMLGAPTFVRPILKRAQPYELRTLDLLVTGASLTVPGGLSVPLPDIKVRFEGERYRFGKIDLTSAIPDLDVNLLRKAIKTEAGGIYNLTAVEDTVLDLTFEAGRYGYAFVDIRPRFDRDTESRVIGVAYEIAEGPRVYVDKVNITGNVRTLDSVIRREFRLSEGDAFNTAKVQRSIQRIRALDYFEDVQVQQQAAQTPLAPELQGVIPRDRVDINVNVREKSTGELTFGFG